MPTPVLKLDGESDYGQVIRQAADALSSGGLVVFPTETVYGIAAAAIPQAVRRLGELKEHREHKPFTIHLGLPAKARDFVPAIPALGQRFIAKGWPGPFTLVFPVPDPAAVPVAQSLDESVRPRIYHGGSVGLRCPDNRAAADLLNEVPSAVVATSANLPGRPPACDAAKVLEQLDGLVDLVVDGGPTQYAKPSTVIRVDEHNYEILRHGVYDARTVRRLASFNILFVCTGNTCRSPMAAAICRQALAERLACSTDELEEKGYTVASAGTFAIDGGRASPGALDVMREQGWDLAGHMTQELRAEMIARADRIYTMTDDHTEAVVRLMPSAAEKTARLDPESDIQDPFGAGAGVYRDCLARIRMAVTRRLEECPL